MIPYITKYMSLMQVKRIAECSKVSILQYFHPSSGYHLSLRSLFCLIFEWPFYTGFSVYETFDINTFKPLGLLTQTLLHLICILIVFRRITSWNPYLNTYLKRLACGFRSIVLKFILNLFILDSSLYTTRSQRREFIIYDL